MLKEPQYPLSIAENNPKVNPAPSTVAPLTCPSCRGTGAVEFDTGIPNQASYGPCADCDGSGEVLDGIAPVTGGFDVFVQGIEFEARNEIEAARIYNAEAVALAIAMERMREEIPLDGVVFGVEIREWEAIEVPF